MGLFHHPFQPGPSFLLQPSCTTKGPGAAPLPLGEFNCMHEVKLYQAIITKQPHHQTECLMAKANEPVVVVVAP